MYKSKILLLFLVVAFILFGVSQFLGNETLGKYSWAIIVPMFAILYFVSVKRKTLFFGLFIGLYAFSDLLELSENHVSSFMYYYLGNSLYIMAYGFLLLEICKAECLFHVLKNYKIQVVVLTALNIYVVYVLQIIINPYLIDEQISKARFLELAYDIVLLLLLSASLLNYFHRDNKKSLLLFIGSLCIVFSEVINVAYLYITDTKMLNFISSALAVLAFYFYYQQSKLENEKANRVVTD